MLKHFSSLSLHLVIWLIGLTLVPLPSQAQNANFFSQYQQIEMNTALCQSNTKMNTQNHSGEMPYYELAQAETSEAVKPRIVLYRPRKEPPMGCFFTWLVPGGGMFYAEQYPWAAAYFVVNASLTIWWWTDLNNSIVNAIKDTAHILRINFFPIVMLGLVRVFEYVHTWVAIQNYNMKYGLSFNYDPIKNTGQLEYTPTQCSRLKATKLVIGASGDCKVVNLGFKMNL